MIASNDANYWDGGFQILVEFSVSMPLEFGERIAEIADILSIASISTEFAEHAVKLFGKSNKLWSTVQHAIVTKILQNIQTKTLICMKLISKCPQFNTECCKLLYEPVKQLSRTKSVDIRCYVPKILVSLVSDRHSQLFADTTEFIFDNIMSEPVPYARFCSVESYQNSDDLEVLALPQILQFFDILVNDESIMVKKSAYSLLAKIEPYNPMMILPIFRRLILESVLSSNYSASLTQQARNTSGKAIILKSAKSILPIYAPVLIPSVLDFLNSDLVSRDSRLLKYTYFEKQSLVSIVQYSIDVIAIICSIDPKLLENNLNDIIPLFIKKLLNSTDKNVSSSLLNAIMLFLDTVGLPIIDTFPGMLDALYDFGAKTQSNTLRAILLQILGKIGLRIPSSIKTDETEVYNTLENVGNSLTYSDWYLQVVSQALLELLDEEMRSDIHFKAQEILSMSLHSSSDRIRPFFDKFIKQLLRDVYRTPVDEAPQYFTLLSSVIKQHGDWLKPYAGDFSKLIDDNYQTCFLDNILPLLPSIINCFGETFVNYLSNHLIKLNSLLSKAAFDNAERSMIIINSFVCITKYTTDFTFVIVNQLVSIAENKQTIPEVVKKCLKGLTLIVMQTNCLQFSSILFRLFCYIVLSSHSDAVKTEAFRLVNTLTPYMGPLISKYTHTLNSFLQANNIAPQNPPLLVNEVEEEPTEFFSQTIPVAIDETALINQTKSDNIVSIEGWKNWGTSFVITSITMSPSSVISSTSAIASANAKFAQKIFYPAFLSIWCAISEATQNCISSSLVHCFEEQSTPMSTIMSMVGLTEFMERADKHLIIPYIILAKAARRAKRFAFALFCLTKEQQEPYDKRGHTTYKMLIDIFSELSMYDDLTGFINSQKTDSKMTPFLAEKLHDWKTASQLYEQDQQANLPQLLVSYSNMQKNEEIANYFTEFDNLQGVMKIQTALPFALAFFSLKNWANFEKVVPYLPKDSIASIIIEAMGDTKMGRPIDKLMQEGFQYLATKAGPLFAHSFNSIAPFIVSSQALIEINEYAHNDISRWDERADRDQQNLKLTKQLYVMRIQMLDGERRMSELIRFLKKARKSGEWQTHSIFFHSYIKDFDERTSDPLLVLEYIYSKGKNKSKSYAIPLLDNLINRLPPSKIQSKVMYKKAQYIVKMGMQADIKTHLQDVTTMCSQIQNRKALSLFAWAHIRLYNMRVGSRSEHAIAAIRAFVNYIRTEKRARLSEIHQLTSIIFRSGKYADVFQSVKDDLDTLTTDRWISVVPQLFAQMDHPVKEINDFVINLVERLLDEYRHVTLFHLLFGINGGCDAKIAGELYRKYELKEPEIVRGTKLFFDGLFKACMTRAETWSEALNSITVPIKQNNMKAVRGILNPLIDEMNYPVTDEDRAFSKEYGPVIRKLSSALREYLKSPKKETVEVLWQHCKDLYTILKRGIDQTSFVDVPSIAPDLAKVKDVNISVPGTFKLNAPLITISLVGRSMEVLRSKQHPKRLCVRGSNGQEFWYLLKGHGDLRLDQRAMQIFNLINDFIPNYLHHIVTYYVMPISTDAGLIEWINKSDTMSKMIRDYRVSNGEPVEREQKMIAQLSVPLIDTLTPIQRYEMLNEVAERTPDSILANVIWLKSRGSESWLAKTQTFCQTAAVMSIAGYLLGLGDRHPSNIMVNADSGTVIHIDLGDCFEVTKERLMFPELIPFRLTRFMIRAFGPCGVKGAFQSASRSIIKIIRKRKESFMAFLEIFVYSPLSAESNNKITNRESETSITSLLQASERSNEEILKPIDSKPMRTIARIADKLCGKEFGEKLSSQQQVEKLVELATDYYNLAHLYRGWNPLW